MDQRFPDRAPGPARRCLLALLVAGLLVALPAAATGHKLGFSLQFRNEVTPYRVQGIFALPGERLDLAIVAGGDGTYRLAAPEARSRETGRGRWQWRAPEDPGLHVLEVARLDTGETMTLNVFVTVPRAASTGPGIIDGYRIGRYPAEPFRGLPAYRPPRGFIRVTRENRDVHVSPHFTLGQFVSKQGGAYPRYMVLRERMLLALEAILEEVRAEGIPAETLTIMSGFRTPWYNAHIGQGRHSRHLWGGAADIYIDQRAPRGRMDDLNGDGRSDLEDARVLARIVARVQRRREPVDFTGGLGIYGPRAHRGPFVHVDVRGYRARWEAP
ncbi:D-Ala-D-Ala carboxypeptidase family metallohydrolase [Aquisalimonas lutea]|uniref:D-Ala-D-Ala carboxypeptidase family metallohydrolase n=1 Tax=Aquisalimonas lutea TaxID=1327750 RepID=UPI0025B51256|nr:D-Ala-D-Ala carboxypeptidase family metallohydrolase [Aquisalimonas lutea]MDN3516436.1 D-Ala-D-Ala carboxypeptidase family metallohydrolase [Aquisalimonas lutea]